MYRRRDTPSCIGWAGLGWATGGAHQASPPPSRMRHQRAAAGFIHGARMRRGCAGDAFERPWRVPCLREPLCTHSQYMAARATVEHQDGGGLEIQKLQALSHTLTCGVPRPAGVTRIAISRKDADAHCIAAICTVAPRLETNQGGRGLTVHRFPQDYGCRSSAPVFGRHLR